MANTATTDAVNQSNENSLQQLLSSPQQNENLSNFTEDSVAAAADPSAWNKASGESGVSQLETTAGQSSLFSDSTMPAVLAGSQQSAGIASVDSLTQMSASEAGQILQSSGALLQDVGSLLSNSQGSLNMQLDTDALNLAQNVLSLDSQVLQGYQNTIAPPPGNPIPVDTPLPVPGSNANAGGGASDNSAGTGSVSDSGSTGSGTSGTTGADGGTSITTNGGSNNQDVASIGGTTTQTVTTDGNTNTSTTTSNGDSSTATSGSSDTTTNTNTGGSDTTANSGSDTTTNTNTGGSDTTANSGSDTTTNTNTGGSDTTANSGSDTTTTSGGSNNQDVASNGGTATQTVTDGNSTTTTTTNGETSTTNTGTVANDTGNYSVINGQIIGPNGQPFDAKGVAVYASQAQSEAATIMQQMPDLNFIRLATTPSQDTPADVQADIQAFQSINPNVVVEVEDHTSGGTDGTTNNTLSGSDLQNEENWYAQVAAANTNNPNVWFGTANEPNDPSNEQDVVDQESGIYNAIRGAGNNNMILMEADGGGSFGPQQADASAYANMNNVAWDIHYYGWETNGDNSVSDNVSAIQNEMAGANGLTESNGSGGQQNIPFIIGEYGDSTDGQSIDSNAQGAVNAVQTANNQGMVQGAVGWTWNGNNETAGSDAMTQDGTMNTVTPYGEEIVNYVNDGTMGNVT